MPKAARVGDACSGHGCFPATSITSGSPDVSINGIPAARQGDSVLLHACPCPKTPHGIHGRSIAAGSSNVFINGLPAARIGDSIGCGGSISAGSGNVSIGNTPYQSPVQQCAENAIANHSPFLKITPLAEPLLMEWLKPFEQGVAQLEAIKRAVQKDKAFIPVCNKQPSQTR